MRGNLRACPRREERRGLGLGYDQGDRLDTSARPGVPNTRASTTTIKSCAEGDRIAKRWRKHSFYGPTAALPERPSNQLGMASGHACRSSTLEFWSIAPPLLERSLADLTQEGFIGKNTCFH